MLWISFLSQHQQQHHHQQNHQQQQHQQHQQLHEQQQKQQLQLQQKEKQVIILHQCLSPYYEHRYHQQKYYAVTVSESL